MPKIPGNFAEVQTFQGFDPLPEGVYRARVEKVVEKPSSTNKPMVEIEMVVTDSPADQQHIGKKIFDRIVLQKNDGSPSDIGFGQLKAYAVATVGEERANSAEGLDTDEWINGEVLVELAQRSYKRKVKNAAGQDEEKDAIGNEVKRILPVA